MKKNFGYLKQRLDYHYKAFNKSRISPDPLEFLHLYKDEKDIEVIGFIASIFSYGNVIQITNSIKKLTATLGRSPYDSIINLREKELQKFKMVHRFYTSNDIKILFRSLKKNLIKEASIKKIFIKFYKEYSGERNLKMPISEFSNYFLNDIAVNGNELSPGIKFMFPDPLKGSACKRINLFLRWMIRKDDLDFGFWNEIPPKKLIIPVDTHIARICRSLGLSKQKNVSWRMAEEITENLKKFDPEDPVKYDFAICHLGMRKMEF